MAKKTVKKKTSSNIEKIDYRKIPLNKGEVGRVIIIQTADGAITTITKSEGKIMSFPEAIGLIEIAKQEAVLSMRSPQQQGPEGALGTDPALLEEVEITLDELDKEMDVEGLIDKMGLKIDGKPIKVSRYAAASREKRRADFQAQKSKSIGPKDN